MLEAWGKPFQHGTRIAIAHGSEQAHHTPTNDCMAHNGLPVPRLKKAIIGKEVETSVQEFPGIGEVAHC
jgi:hypothetical protein